MSKLKYLTGLFLTLCFVYVDLTVVIFGRQQEALIALAMLITEALIAYILFMKRSLK